jgi:hypothetical protein
MNLASASSVAISLKLIGQRMYKEWMEADSIPESVEEVYEVCKRFFIHINAALARCDDHDLVIEQLAIELEEMEQYYQLEPFIADDLAMLLDIVRMSLEPELTVKHFEKA